MEIVSLHPLDIEVVQRYVGVLNGVPAGSGEEPWQDRQLRDSVERARGGDERAAARLGHGLALALARATPVFSHRACGLSFWEAQVDRPIGMLMRPPSRLFTEAGLDPAVARAMPIRLDTQIGMMGGAYIPARLIDRAIAMLDEHLDRSVKRLVAAEVDPVPTLGLMHEALAWAGQHGLGLYEALDVVGPDGEGVPGATVILPDRSRLERDLLERIVTSAKPPKKPGLLQRLFGRSAPTPGVNGHHPDR